MRALLLREAGKLQLTCLSLNFSVYRMGCLPSREVVGKC